MNKNDGCFNCGKTKEAELSSRTTTYTIKKGKDAGKRAFGSIALCTDCVDQVDRGKAL